MPSMQEPFLIYNASAGAGKTYQLVRNYLKICLSTKDPLRFMHILAITFTNKAAREMKNRLLAQLQNLKSYPEISDKEKAYAEELAKELGIEVIDLKYRAKQCLSAILHHYGAFSVSTIDSFTNRLIRSFSRDLQINGNFQVEVENERILEEAVDRLLEDLQGSDPFTRILSRYIQQQREEERSSNIRSLLLDKGKELFAERAFPYLESLKQLEAQSILEVETELRRRQTELRTKLKTTSDDFINGCKNLNLSKTDFRSRGVVYTWVEKVGMGHFPDYNQTFASTFNEMGPDYLPSTKSAKEGAFAIEENRIAIFESALKVKDLYEHSIEELFLLGAVLKSLHGLALLGAIEQKIEEIKAESGRLPIGDFNKIVAKELGDQPAPFLYERLGERYSDFFIDEFQDTSKLQWSNLLPLVNNALAGTKSSAMVVGDAKQSIYRFRGGDLQLFVDLVKDVDPSNRLGNQVLYERRLENMGDNYRSAKAIVQFNNQLFQKISQYLPNPQFKEIYKDGQQVAKNSEEGHLSLEILEARASAEQYHEALLVRINDLFSRGYQQRDICILSRSNAKGKAAASFLLENENKLQLPQEEALQILSADSLIVGASKEVKALISFLKTSENPDQLENRRAWMAYLAERQEIDQHSFRMAIAELDFNNMTTVLESFNIDEWQGSDLLEKCYQLLKAFSMDWQTDPYLQFFLDQVRDYQSHNRPLVSEFIDWWEDRGQDRSVSIPPQTNAIQIMSVHKSKGLEFPVVIYLYAKGALDSLGGGAQKHSGWVRTDESKYGLPFAFIDFVKPPLPENQPIYNGWYLEELSWKMMDELNVYYVAFTRAQTELHLLSELAPKDQKGKTYIQKVLMDEFSADSIGLYSIGTPGITSAAGELKEGIAIHSAPVIPWREKLEMISSAPRHWQSDRMKEARFGTKMHQLLSELNSRSDLERILKKAQEEAWFSAEDLTQLKISLEQIFAKKELEALFHPQARVYNEHSILVPKGDRKIPDRIVQHQNRWYLADYKTGTPSTAHNQQVLNYVELLDEAGIKIEQAFLIYLQDPPEVMSLL